MIFKVHANVNECKGSGPLIGLVSYSVCHTRCLSVKANYVVNKLHIFVEIKKIV